MRDKFLRGNGEKAPGSVVENSTLPVDGYIIGYDLLINKDPYINCNPLYAPGSFHRYAIMACGETNRLTNTDGAYYFYSTSTYSVDNAHNETVKTLLSSIPYTLPGERTGDGNDIVPSHIVTRYLIRAIP